MLALFEKLSNAGVNPSISWREAKSIRLRNQLALVTTALLLGNVPLQILYWEKAHFIFYTICLNITIQSLTIVFNQIGWRLVSYVTFLIVPLFSVAAYTTMSGAATNIPLFMMTIVNASFFTGGNEYPRTRNILVSACVTAFAILELHPLFQQPHLIDDAEYLRWLRHTIDFGLVWFTLGISFHIAKGVRFANNSIELERGKSEKLLLNILPEAIATQLKKNDQGVIAERYEESSVLFADIAGFTVLSSTMSADKVVAMLDEIFRSFDELTARLGLEKIKTIGDAYMVASGLPTRRADHCAAIFELACGMQRLMREKFSAKYDGLELRIGIHTGPVVAGVIGNVKFAYDLWGDTVNTASRMESHGVTGQIHITQAVFEKLQTKHKFESREAMEIKGKGKMVTYLHSGI